MFKYQDTKKTSNPGELQRKVVTEVREVTYINFSKDPKATEPVMTKGFETVKEIVVSSGFGLVEPKVVGTKTVDNRQEKDRPNAW